MTAVGDVRWGQWVSRICVRQKAEDSHHTRCLLYRAILHCIAHMLILDKKYNKNRVQNMHIMSICAPLVCVTVTDISTNVWLMLIEVAKSRISVAKFARLSGCQNVARRFDGKKFISHSWIFSFFYFVMTLKFGC